MLTEGSLQIGLVDQAFGILHPDGLPASVEARAGNQTVNVRMKPQLLVPCVQHGGKAIDGRPEAFVGGQFFGESTGDGGKEQIKSLAGMRPEKARTQFIGQSEGDQEVGRVDEFTQFTPDPRCGGGFSTLWAGFVVTGMVGEMKLATGSAAKTATAQRRGATMGDGPEGAALRRGKDRIGLVKLRQETTQSPDDRGGITWRGAHGVKAPPC